MCSKQACQTSHCQRGYGWGPKFAHMLEMPCAICLQSLSNCEASQAELAQPEPYTNKASMHSRHAKVLSHVKRACMGMNLKPWLCDVLTIMPAKFEHR